MNYKAFQKVALQVGSGPAGSDLREVASLTRGRPAARQLHVARGDCPPPRPGGGGGPHPRTLLLAQAPRLPQAHVLLEQQDGQAWWVSESIFSNKYEVMHLFKGTLSPDFTNYL